MEMEAPEIAISCGVVLVHQEKILLVKHTDAYGGGYSIPKGKLEDGEDIRSCALREFIEETGITIEDTDLSPFPEVLHIMDREGNVVKRVHYFIARVDLVAMRKRGAVSTNFDVKEIADLRLASFEQAEALLPISQLSVLHHLGHRFSPKELLSLLRWKLITRSLDLDTGLYIYNYSKRCKEINYWNHTTLSCRGLILDRNFKVVARAFKKFFEWCQLPPELQSYLLSRRHQTAIRSYEKIDGTLILIFNYQGRWIITNRRRLDLVQTHHAETVLNRYHSGLLGDLDPDLTYLFESTVHYDYNVINYTTENLVLLCAVGRAKGVVQFPEVLIPNLDHARALGALEVDHKPIEYGAEGCVHHLDGQYMIKAKTDWYRNMSADRARISE